MAKEFTILKIFFLYIIFCLIIIISLPSFARLDVHECPLLKPSRATIYKPKAWLPALVTFYSGKQGLDGAKEINVKKNATWDKTAIHYYGANKDNNINNTAELNAWSIL